MRLQISLEGNKGKTIGPEISEGFYKLFSKYMLHLHSFKANLFG
jgi:hypothetical protein